MLVSAIGDLAEAVTAPARQIEAIISKHKGTCFSCMDAPREITASRVANLNQLALACNAERGAKYMRRKIESRLLRGRNDGGAVAVPA